MESGVRIGMTTPAKRGRIPSLFGVRGRENPLQPMDSTTNLISSAASSLYRFLSPPPPPPPTRRGVPVSAIFWTPGTASTVTWLIYFFLLGHTALLVRLSYTRSSLKLLRLPVRTTARIERINEPMFNGMRQNWSYRDKEERDESPPLHPVASVHFPAPGHRRVVKCSVHRSDSGGSSAPLLADLVFRISRAMQPFVVGVVAVVSSVSRRAARLLADGVEVKSEIACDTMRYDTILVYYTS